MGNYTLCEHLNLGKNLALVKICNDCVRCVSKGLKPTGPQHVGGCTESGRNSLHLYKAPSNLTGDAAFCSPGRPDAAALWSQERP